MFGSRLRSHAVASHLGVMNQDFRRSRGSQETRQRLQAGAFILMPERFQYLVANHHSAGSFKTLNIL